MSFFIFYNREEVKTTEETTETPEIKTKTVEDVKKAVEEAEQVHLFILTVNHELFSSHSLPSADSRRVVVRFWQKNVHNTG